MKFSNLITGAHYIYEELGLNFKFKKRNIFTKLLIKEWNSSICKRAGGYGAKRGYGEIEGSHWLGLQQAWQPGESCYKMIDEIETSYFEKPSSAIN